MKSNETQSWFSTCVFNTEADVQYVYRCFMSGFTYYMIQGKCAKKQTDHCPWMVLKKAFELQTDITELERTDCSCLILSREENRKPAGVVSQGRQPLKEDVGGWWAGGSKLSGKCKTFPFLVDQLTERNDYQRQRTRGSCCVGMSINNTNGFIFFNLVWFGSIIFYYINISGMYWCSFPRMTHGAFKFPFQSANNKQCKDQTGSTTCWCL